MKIENVITYSIYRPAYKAHEEQTVWLQRPYKLTYAGAQRIIRRDSPTANVVRIETLIRQ